MKVLVGKDSGMVRFISLRAAAFLRGGRQFFGYRLQGLNLASDPRWSRPPSASLDSLKGISFKFWMERGEGTGWK
ncbi:hypothetical protein ACMG4J_18685 [Rossellomorea marisflavi]|uniref:hypothetical protein n=1 Tax=Rossellomorea marisflavi TaxID=189381 RepID=UPI0039BF9DBF